MQQRSTSSPADYLVAAVVPPLIMILIASLVFFLTTIFYDGDHPVRLKVILALFIMATVLISRISMREGWDYAALFGAPLAVVSLLAMIRFTADSWVQGVGIGTLLLGIVWWCAAKLTWDCTWVDEQQEAAGEGLLELAGLDRPLFAGGGDEPVEEVSGDKSADAAVPNSLATLLSWWRRFAARRRRPHPPGVWVVYFSLAATALFGLGQWWIPARQEATRRQGLVLLVVYLAACLGLLLTTSFLGLRRFLRARRVTMPAEIARVWLALGAAAIAGLLLFCLVLPRLSSGVTLASYPLRWLSSGPLTPSRWGLGREGVPPEPSAADNSTEGRSNSARLNEGHSNEARSNEEQAKEGQAAGSGTRPQGAPSGQSSRRQAERTREPESSPSHSEDVPQDAGKSADQQAGSDSREAAQVSAESPEQRASRDDRAVSPPDPGSSRERATAMLATSWRWLWRLLLLVAVACAVYRFRGRLGRVLAVVWEQWRRLWQAPAREQAGTAVAGSSATVSAVAARRPFASFANPFQVSGGPSADLGQLTRYSFQALEAWARERGVPRREDQTPAEFCQAMERREARLAGHASRLGELYNLLAYAEGRLPAQGRVWLEEFWQRLPAVREDAS